MLALFGHAVIYLLLSAAEVIWVGATAVRVWRRREEMTHRARSSHACPALADPLVSRLAK